MFKKGDVIRLQGSEKHGIVIDWGIYHQKYRRYMLAKRDMADCVRVWTSSAIEIWPINLILTEPRTPTVQNNAP